MAKNTVKSNLHTHTNFSDGADSVEANIKAALDAGFVSLGLSDHSYVEQAGFGISSANADVYVAEVRRCAEKYRDRIEIFCGLELDADTEYRQELYDYIIASVHFVNAGGQSIPVDLSREVQRDCIDRYFDSDEAKYAEAYFSSLVRHVERTKPDIVGHFDLLTKYNSIDQTNVRYRRCALDAVHSIAESCRRFEVNTGAMARRLRTSPYPADFILRELLELGCTVTLSSDAHRAENIDYAFAQCAEYLRSLGFTRIDRLTSHGFVSDAL